MQTGTMAPRRRHAYELKARVLAACAEPGASVAADGRRSGPSTRANRKGAGHRLVSGVVATTDIDGHSQSACFAGLRSAGTRSFRRLCPASPCTLQCAAGLTTARRLNNRAATSPAELWPTNAYKRKRPGKSY